MLNLRNVCVILSLWPREACRIMNKWPCQHVDFRGLTPLLCNLYHPVGAVIFLSRYNAYRCGLMYMITDNN